MAAEAVRAAAAADRRKFVLDAEWVQAPGRGTAPDAVADLKFIPGPVSIVLTFQVNCPGCFMNALPSFIELARKEDLAKRGLRCALVATAFEDYEYNTRDNLLSLLRDGTVVGETLKLYREHGKELGVATPGDRADESKEPGGDPRCPLDLSGLLVGWDKVAPATDEAREAMAQAMFNSLKAQLPPGMPPEMLRARIREHAASRTHSAATFDGNMMQGTPTWAICDADMTVLEQVTGHPSAASLAAAVGKILEARGL